MIEVNFILLSRKVIALLISGSLAVGTVVPVFAETLPVPIVRSVSQAQEKVQLTGEYHLNRYDVINIVIIGFAEGYFTDTVTLSDNVSQTNGQANVSKSSSNTFNDVMIGPDGYVNLPYAGNVKLAGLTIPEATQVLTVKLGEYIKIPAMSIMVKQYAPHKVYVMGEVKTPGVYSLGSDYMNLFAALSSAGGITKRGRPKHIGLVRMVNGKVQMQEINFDNFIEKQDAAQNPMLYDGDMIFVPKSDKIDLSEDVLPMLSTIVLFRTF